MCKLLVLAWNTCEQIICLRLEYFITYNCTNKWFSSNKTVQFKKNIKNIIMIIIKHLEMNQNLPLNNS